MQIEEFWEAYTSSEKELFQRSCRRLCVLFTEEVGGILTLEFDENGTLLFKTEADENDLLYDDIACGMLIKKLQYEKRDLLESMEMFYRVFFLGE